jgi:hypothetical protein
MEKILIPTIMHGDTVYKKLIVSTFEKEQMELIGFEYSNNVLLWDYTYIFSDDPKVFATGEHERETINLLLKADI